MSDSENFSNEQTEQTQPIVSATPVNPQNGKQLSGTEVKSTPKTATSGKSNPPSTKTKGGDPWEDELDKDFDRSKATLHDFEDFATTLRFLKHYSRVEQICDQHLGKVRCPKFDNKYVPFYEPTTYNGAWSTFGTGYSWTKSANINPAAETNWASNLVYNTPPSNRITIRKMCNQLAVMRETETTSLIVTNFSKLRQDWLINGARQLRSEAQVTASFLTNLIGTEIDPNFTAIETEFLANWMYQPSVANGTVVQAIHIINASDLVEFRNLVKPSPIPNDTFCLALRELNTDALKAKLCLFGSVFLDFDNSITPNSTYNGCPSYEVAAGTNFVYTHNDDDIGRVIDRSYSEQEIEFGMLLNSFYLPAGNITGTNITWDLSTFRSTVQDRVINYLARHSDSLNTIGSPNFVNNRKHWFYDWRIIVTMLLQKVLMCYGMYGSTLPTQTEGLAFSYTYINNVLFAMWTPDSAVFNTVSNTPLWIPFEYWLCNTKPDTPIKLDDDVWERGVSGEPTNIQFGVPRSYIASVANDSNGSPVYASYYLPNATAAVNSGAFYTYYSRAVPGTLPRYSSTCKTMSLSQSDMLPDFEIKIYSTRHGPGRSYATLTRTVPF